MTADPPSVLELARSLAGYITHRKIAHDGQALHPACPLMSLRSTPSGVPQPKREVSEEGTEKQRERGSLLQRSMMLVSDQPCHSRLLAFVLGLGDVRTTSAYLKLDISTNKWQQQQVFWARRSIVWIKNNPSRGNCTAMDGESFRDPQAETDDGVGLTCYIAQFRSFIAARLGFTAGYGGRVETRGVLQSWFLLPSNTII